MSIDDMIAVLQAAKDGKQIQYSGGAGGWNDLAAGARFNFIQMRYRIKPIPLKPLHRCEGVECVVRHPGHGVCLAVRYDSLYAVHTACGVFFANDTHLARLTRAEVEAAGWEWPENAREP